MIEGIFATKESADRKAVEVRDYYVAMDRTPWIDAAGYQHAGWDFDVHVEEHEVRP
ncbi:MAG: hypothetical protein WAT39_01935 [Planctomycetota bacterium]